MPHPQHLSDEAVAAFADGVLTGLARERARRHVDSCGECRVAVKEQREAAFALRTAVAPALPSSLVDRLRTVPLTTPITALPTTVDDDGTPLLSTFAPMAAFVPSKPERHHRVRPFVATAAAVAVAGTLAVGSVARSEEPAQTGSGRTVQHVTPGLQGRPAVMDPVTFLRANRP